MVKCTSWTGGSPFPCAWASRAGAVCCRTRSPTSKRFCPSLHTNLALGKKPLAQTLAYRNCPVCSPTAWYVRVRLSCSWRAAIHRCGPRATEFQHSGAWPLPIALVGVSSLRWCRASCKIGWSEAAYLISSRPQTLESGFFRCLGQGNRKSIAACRQKGLGNLNTPCGISRVLQRRWLIS